MAYACASALSAGVVTAATLYIGGEVASEEVVHKIFFQINTVFHDWGYYFNIYKHYIRKLN